MHRNASDHYWIASLSNTFRQLSRGRLQSLLPVEDVVESWGLTDLHKTVLKLNNLEVCDVLRRISKPGINFRDHRGRTALWWASRRGDTAMTSILIQNGADVNIPSELGYLPLHTALWNSEKCAKILLDANADTASVDGNGWPTLVVGSYRGASINIIERIILQGNNINIMTKQGFTALMAAAQEGHTQVCEYLISQNANKDFVNNHGECALHFAVCNRRSEPTRLLLAQGAEHSLRTKAGESLLHYGAMYGDVATLNALLSVPLKGINLEDRITSSSPVQKSKDVIGCTAALIAKQRSDVAPEWHEAFQRLVRAIDMANRGSEGLETPNCASHLAAANPSNTDDVDYFEDAVEHQIQEPLNTATNRRARSRTF